MSLLRGKRQPSVSAECTVCRSIEPFINKWMSNQFCCCNKQTNWPMKGCSWSAIQSVVQSMTALTAPKTNPTGRPLSWCHQASECWERTCWGPQFLSRVGNDTKTKQFIHLFIDFISGYGIWSSGGTFKVEWILLVGFKTGSRRQQRDFICSNHTSKGYILFTEISELRRTKMAA